MSYYFSIKHWVLHITCISPVSQLKMFVLFKFRDDIKIIAPRPTAAFLGLWHVKKNSAFSFKLNLLFKTIAALFSEINPESQSQATLLSDVVGGLIILFDNF